MSGKNLAKVAELDTRGWDDSLIVAMPGGAFGVGIHHLWRSETKVRNARPASAADFCIPSGDNSQTIRITDQSVCDADLFLAPHSSPRQVAGGSTRRNWGG